MFGGKLKSENQQLKEELEKAKEEIKSLTRQVDDLRRANNRLSGLIEDERKKTAEARVMAKTETAAYPAEAPASAPPTVTFGKWDPAVHLASDQKLRQERAIEIKPYSVDLNAIYLTATIRGSYGTYNVTLDSCECDDFRRRNLPCKHMYRLAMELGKFPGLNDKIPVEEVLRITSVLSYDDRVAFGYACYTCGKNNKNGPAKLDGPLADYLYRAGLIEYTDDLTPTFNVTQKDVLVELFGARFGLDTKMKKSEMVERLKGNVTVEDFPIQYRRPMILLSPKIANDAIKIQRRLY